MLIAVQLSEKLWSTVRTKLMSAVTRRTRDQCRRSWGCSHIP